MSRSVAIDVYQWLREICGWRLINHDDLRLGGAGPAGPIHSKVVEIDESCFSHKPKVAMFNLQKYRADSELLNHHTSFTN